MVEKEAIHYSKKVCLVGDPEVGKTSLVRRFVLDKYDDSYYATIGAKVMKKDVELHQEGQDYLVTLMVWDVMGQKHFRIIESVAFQHVTSALIVCDLTRKKTFDNLEYWIKALTRISGRIPIIILANKLDLIGDAKVDEGMVMEFAARYKSTYFMTSAKTGDNVENAFRKLAKQCLVGVSDE